MIDSSDPAPTAVPQSVLEAAFHWDTRTWSRAWQIWRASSSLSLSGSSPNLERVLELGGGANGGVTLAVGCLATPTTRVVFSSIDPIEETTRSAHIRAGTESKVSYARLDASAVGIRPGSVDLVITKSVLGGIGRDGDIEAAAAVAREIHRVLRPGGEYWFAENARATPVHRFARRRYGAGRHLWHYYTQEEMKAVLSTFDEHEMCSVGLLAAFGRSERQRSWLARLDRVVDEKLPSRWRYVWVGVARKAT